MQRLATCVVIVVLAMCHAHAVTQQQHQSVILKAQGDTCRKHYRYAEALDCYTQAIREAKKEGNKRMYAVCLGSVGNVCAELGDHKRSLYYYQEAYQPIMDLNDPNMQMSLMVNLVNAYCNTGHVADAKACFSRIAPLNVTDTQAKQYLSLTCQGNIAKAEGKDGAARYYLRQAQQFAKDNGMQQLLIYSLYSEIGDLSLSLGDTTDAVQQYRDGLHLSLQQHDNPQAAYLYKCLSDIYRQRGDSTLAVNYHQRYLAMRDSLFNQEQFFIANDKLFGYDNWQTGEQIYTLTLHRRGLLAGIVILLLVLAVIGVLYGLLRRNNRNLRQAQQLLVKKNDDLMAINEKHDRILQEYIKEKQVAQVAPPVADSDAPAATDSPSTDVEPADATTSNASDTSLTDDVKRELLSKIVTVMSDVSVISNPDFSLATLTDMVNSNTRYVSWVINNEYGKNFKSLLNEYRIREACRRLTDHEHYGNLTLQAIYEELGFNNAGSFITAFRKVTGMTPSRYKKLKE